VEQLMTKQEMASIFERQLAMHGVTVSRAVLEDAAAQVLMVLMCRDDDGRTANDKDGMWRPSDEVRQ
jgi:hypothetical protein